MIGNNVETIKELLSSSEVTGSDLIFVSTSLLCKAVLERGFMSRHIRIWSVAELFCRYVWNTHSQDCGAMEDVLSQETCLPRETILEIAQGLQEEEIVISGKQDHARSNGPNVNWVFNKYERILAERKEVWCAIKNRMIHHWSSDGFILVYSEKKNKTFQIPFRLCENEGGYPCIKFKDGVAHEVWTKSFENVARTVGMMGVDVELDVKWCGDKGMGENSFMLPLLLAWWRHQSSFNCLDETDDLFEYNPFRVFATGAFEDGRFVSVGHIEEKEKFVEDIEAAVLIRPNSYECEKGEIDYTRARSVDQVKQAVFRILRAKYSAADIPSGVKKIWGERRIAERLLRLAGPQYGTTRFIKCVDALPIGSGGEYSKRALSLLREICVFANSADGGALILGVYETSSSVMPAELSRFGIDGRLPAFEWQGGAWDVAGLEKGVRENLHLWFRDGVMVKTEGQHYEKWLLTTSDGGSLDMNKVVKDVVASEYLGRPVVVLSIPPSVYPIVLQHDCEFAPRRKISSRHICGGRGKSTIPGWQEWSPKDLVLSWSLWPNSIKYRTMIEKEKRDAGSWFLKKRHVYKKAELIRRVFFGEMVSLSGADFPRRCSSKARELLKQLYERSQCYGISGWRQVLSDDEMEVNEVYVNFSLLCLQIQECGDGSWPLPLTPDSRDVEGAKDFFDVLHSALNRKIPQQTLSRNQFREMILEGWFKPLLNMTMLSKNILSEKGIRVPLLSISTAPGSTGFVFGSSDWAAEEVPFEMVPLVELRQCVDRCYENERICEL